MTFEALLGVTWIIALTTSVVPTTPTVWMLAASYTGLALGIVTLYVRNEPCHCFGESKTKTSLWQVARTGLLAAAAVYVAIDGVDAPPSVYDLYIVATAYLALLVMSEAFPTYFRWSRAARTLSMAAEE